VNSKVSVDPAKSDNIERSLAFYIERIYPGIALSETQLKEVRQAFFAGVTWMISELHAMGDRNFPDAVAAHCLEAVARECRQFGGATGIGRKLHS
jgi:hypothetical protein